MEVIVTGATGFIGGEVVKKCIAHPSIDSVLVLSRKEIPANLSDSKKVKVILHKDFSEYPESLLEELSGAVGCVWAIGGKATDFPNAETAKKVSIDFTLAAAMAFAKSIAPRMGQGKKFRFILVSGWSAEMDQKKKLWFMEDTRKIKGAVEKGLFDVEKANSSTFEAYTLRPGGVLPEGDGIMNSLQGALSPCVKVDDLAMALIDVCVKGYDRKILENDVVNRVGKEASKNLS